MVPFTIAAWCALAAQASAGAVNFRGSGRIAASEVGIVLRQELVDEAHHLQRFEGDLRQMFVSLPKNEHGNLGHQTVRYALHRFFVDRFAWYIGGLEPSASSNATELPNILQTAFERQAGHKGVDLHGLAVMAASLEDLAEKEMQVRLRDAFKANDVTDLAAPSHENATEVLNTYLISFLISSNWTVTSTRDLKWKKMVFFLRYRNLNGTGEWYKQIKDRHLGTSSTKAVSYEAMTKAAGEIGKTYHNYNDLDCKSLKTTLKGMESRKPGRVRLSVFYNMSFHSHFAFTEPTGFLRALGALDESDPKQLSVIIPNYALSRLNCLNATNLYAICCRNTCDDLTSHLEKELGAPTASVGRLVEVVSSLASDSVPAPRELPDALVGRLEEVSAHHNGHIPIYGRLFAQWMHHAYPLECPYPQVGALGSSLTPKQWLDSGEAAEADEDVMRQTVEADICAVNPDGKSECGEESIELPWSMTEELLLEGAGHQHPRSSGARSDGAATRRPLLGLASLLLALYPAWALRSAAAKRRLDLCLGVPVHRHVLAALLSLLLLAAACCADLLDLYLLCVGLVASTAAGTAKLLAGRFGSRRAKGFQYQSSLPLKCV